LKKKRESKDPPVTSFKGSATPETTTKVASKHNGIRVLHVDDDLNQLLFTKIFLEEFDSELTVQSVSEPLEAVEALEAEDYDCVISDYQMDAMDGITLTHRVRERSDIPIIIYTGRGSEEVEAIARAAGADGYVKKELDPCHYRSLYEQIKFAIQERG
jgi:CheY-like chemotaxis protein